MRFEWDETKNASNLHKHGIRFEDAVQAFADPCSVSKLRSVVEGEQRWLTFGTLSAHQILAVAHTFVEEEHEELIRIISARPATRRERQDYEEEIG